MLMFERTGLGNWRNLLPCLLCGQRRSVRHQCCAACWQDLPWHQHQVQRLDVSCQAILHYQFPVNRLLQGLKDQARFEHVQLLAGCLLTLPRPSVQAIVPMPMATERLIERGFNQILLLAQVLSRQWRLPLWQPVQRQSRHSQRGLSRQDRLDNLDGAFMVRHGTQRQQTYRRVLMLDDVITTGASLSALQQQLQQLGCQDIQALCLCDAAPQRIEPAVQKNTLQQGKRASSIP